MTIYEHDPILAAYFSDVRQRSMLPDSEQRDLASKIQSYVAKIGKYEEKLGNKRVRQNTKVRIREELPVLREELRDLQSRLTEANLRFVISEGKKQTNRGLEYLDLIQEGNLQMFDKGTEKYDPNNKSNSKFISYAGYWIWQGMTRAIADQSSTIRVKGSMHDALLKVKLFSNRFFTKNGRKPYPEEISKSTGIPLDKVKLALEHSREIFSLDAPTGENDDMALADTIPYENDSPEEKGTKYKPDIDFLLNHSGANKRERLVIDLRFGLTSKNPMKLREVGNEIGNTREWARKIEEKALEKLRATAERYDMKLEDIL